jgi:GNAT superfamily N-acetyltransferase
MVVVSLHERALTSPTGILREYLSMVALGREVVGQTVIIRQEGKLAGWAVLTPDRRLGGGAVLGVFVAPEYRRQGIGIGLLREMLRLKGFGDVDWRGFPGTPEARATFRKLKNVVFHENGTVGPKRRV